MSVRWLAMVLLAAIAALGGCGGDAETAAGPQRYPIRVVCTVGMVSDIVRQVGGEKVDVKGLIGEGVDPHLYKATRDDVAALSRADIVFYSGLMLEGKLADTLVKIGQRKPAHAVTAKLDKQYLLFPQSPQHPDPHVWMDPAAWSQAVGAVAEALSAFDPANAATYEQNARAYRAEIDKLSEYGTRVLASVPSQRRILITSHDAFGYFGRAFGLEVMGVQGLSTESEAGLQDIQRLIELLVSRNVQAVFVESSVPEKNIRALIEGTQARGKKVTIGGSLYSDAMGPTGSYEGTYIGMIDHNITTIARALGGDAPAGGMQGKLKAP